MYRNYVWEIENCDTIVKNILPKNKENNLFCKAQLVILIRQWFVQMFQIYCKANMQTLGVRKKVWIVNVQLWVGGLG